VGFSIGVYFLLKAPIWLIGFLAMSRSGVSTDTVREDIQEFREKQA